MNKRVMTALRWTLGIFLLCFSIGYSFFQPGDYSVAAFAALGTYACQKLQTELVKYFGKNAPQFRTLGSTALIKWLLSPQNTANFTRINVETIPGKKRAVAFNVESPMCFSLCKVGLACDATPALYQPVDQEIVFTLEGEPFRHCDGEGDATVLYFDEEDLMKYCTKDNTTWIQNKIIRYLFRFEEALDAALTTLIEAQLGNNGKDEAITNVPIFTASNQFNPNMSSLNPEAMWYLNQVYLDMGMEGQFAMIGGTIVNKIAQFKQWATANPAGVDMSKRDAINPYPFYDRNFNTTFGESDFLMLAPGAVQLVTWNKYKGERRRGVTDLYSKGTITLPTTGLEVDWKWYYDYKCEKWTFEAFLYAELATVLKGGCGDGVQNTNGLIRVHDCGTQPIVPECPEQIEA